ncbi:MAG: nucleotidyltransferase family protein [Verrucomicrobiae bacterium]|nr:nucleotidyltransferase family protein [Verrucomicrobiae bacterium]
MISIPVLTGLPVYVTSSVMQPNGHRHLGVVILGAGASSRMGRPKLLLPWAGTTVIGRLLAQWRELGAGQIAVVRRPEDVALVAELDRLGFPAADQIINPQPERGMFSSIICAAGWGGWRGEISNWAIVLGDQPHLTGGTLQALLAFSMQNRNAICQPTSGGRKAHPVILPRPAFDLLKSTQAATLKDFLNLAECPNVQCVINDPSLTLDLDTPEDYKRLLAKI